MDLRFEAAAANEYAENTKNDVGFSVPQIYWNYTSENVMTLDWVDGISIRETQELKDKNFNTQKIAEDVLSPPMADEAEPKFVVLISSSSIG